MSWCANTQSINEDTEERQGSQNTAFLSHLQKKKRIVTNNNITNNNITNYKSALTNIPTNCNIETVLAYE